MIDELEALEDLHRFHITRVDEIVFEYVYASHFRITIPCKNYLPIATSVDITRVGNPMTKAKDDFPKLSNILLQAAKALVHRSRPTSCKKVISVLQFFRPPLLTPLQIIHQLADYWSSCSQLRAQLRLLAVKYPVEILPADSDGFPGFKARTKVMIPSKKAKAFIIFNFTPDIFSQWPLSINLLTCDVEVSYGSVE